MRIWETIENCLGFGWHPAPDWFVVSVLIIFALSPLWITGLFYWIGH